VDGEVDDAAPGEVGSHDLDVRGTTPSWLWAPAWCGGTCGSKSAGRVPPVGPGSSRRTCRSQEVHREALPGVNRASSH